MTNDAPFKRELTPWRRSLLNSCRIAGAAVILPGLLILSISASQPADARGFTRQILDGATQIFRQEVPFASMIPSDRLESGKEAKENDTRLLSELHWFHALSEAEQEAAKEHKLVFWMHMLGDIEGKT